MRLIDADALKESFALNANIHISKRLTVLGVIAKAPTIEAEPVRRGHWEVIDEAEPRRYGCSVCKVLSFYLYRYCPCCGAKMEEEK